MIGEDDVTMDITEKIAKLEQDLADLKKRWPAHSVKPEMIEKMEQIEDKIEQLKKIRAISG